VSRAFKSCGSAFYFLHSRTTAGWFCCFLLACRCLLPSYHVSLQTPVDHPFYDNVSVFEGFVYLFSTLFGKLFLHRCMSRQLEFVVIRDMIGHPTARFMYVLPSNIDRLRACLSPQTYPIFPTLFSLPSNDVTIFDCPGFCHDPLLVVGLVPESDFSTSFLSLTKSSSRSIFRSFLFAC